MATKAESPGPSTLHFDWLPSGLSLRVEDSVVSLSALSSRPMGKAEPLRAMSPSTLLRTVSLSNGLSNGYEGWTEDTEEGWSLKDEF